MSRLPLPHRSRCRSPSLARGCRLAPLGPAHRGPRLRIRGTTQDSFKIPGSDTQRTNDMLADRFPAMSGTSARVVAHNETGALDPSEFTEVSNALRAMPSVSDVAAPALSPDRRPQCSRCSTTYRSPSSRAPRRSTRCEVAPRSPWPTGLPGRVRRPGAGERPGGQRPRGDGRDRGCPASCCCCLRGAGRARRCP